MYIAYIWGACGFATGVVMATIGMLIGVWLDDRRNER